MPSTFDETEFKRAQRAAFHLLKYRLRSKHEINVKLQQKGFSRSTIRQTISYLEEYQLIDDQEFARQWISSRLNKPFGFSRIKLELRQKGIDQDVISRTIESAKSEYDEERIVEEIAIRRKTKYKGIDESIAKQRLYGFLIRRGFDIQVINKVVTKL